MTRIGDLAASLWQRLNPSEPSKRHLVAFYVFAILVFALGIWIGHRA